MTGLWIFLGVLAVLAIFQRKNLMRIVTAVTAQFGKLSRFIWRADPIAVYQAEVDRSVDEIREATVGLEEYRGMLAQIEREVAVREREVVRLTAKVKTFIASDETKAAEYALQLKKAQAALEEKKLQVTSYATSYENNLKKVKFARERIEAVKEKARTLDADLRLSKAEAASNFAEKFNVRTNSLEGLGEIEEEIQRQIDLNRGKAQVARDLSTDGTAEIDEAEALHKAEAQEVLEQMKKEMGLNK